MWSRQAIVRAEPSVGFSYTEIHLTTRTRYAKVFFSIDRVWNALLVKIFYSAESYQRKMTSIFCFFFSFSIFLTPVFERVAIGVSCKLSKCLHKYLCRGLMVSFAFFLFFFEGRFTSRYIFAKDDDSSLFFAVSLASTNERWRVYSSPLIHIQV